VGTRSERKENGRHDNSYPTSDTLDDENGETRGSISDKPSLKTGGHHRSKSHRTSDGGRHKRNRKDRRNTRNRDSSVRSRSRSKSPGKAGDKRKIRHNDECGDKDKAVDHQENLEQELLIKDGSTRSPRSKQIAPSNRKGRHRKKDKRRRKASSHTPTHRDRRKEKSKQTKENKQDSSELNSERNGSNNNSRRKRQKNKDGNKVDRSSNKDDGEKKIKSEMPVDRQK
jgi:hypothetical protein